MPDLVSQVSAVTGFAAGLLSGWTLAKVLPRFERRPVYLRGRLVEPPPFENGKLIVFERDSSIHGLPVGVRLVEPVAPEWTPTRETLEQLAEVVRRASYRGVPGNGVRLSWSACKAAGIKRLEWERLVAFVLRPPAVGYRRDRSVWLSREKCEGLMRWRP